MNTRTDTRAPATTFLVHFFGCGLVDEGRCYAVERFVSLSNGDIRRRPADAVQESTRPAESRGRHVRRGPRHAPGVQRDHRLHGTGYTLRHPILGTVRMRHSGRPPPPPLSGAP